MTVTTSRASAAQRRGRAGRLGPGTCYRLYTRHVHASMLPFTPPEIVASDLSSLVLELAAWGITDPLALAWLDPPPKASWEAARQLLMDLGALDRSGTVTPAGRIMVRLPLHPRLARLLMRAAELGRLSLGADLAALLSERDIIRRNIPADRERPGGADISERLAMLRRWREEKQAPAGTDRHALQAVDRAAGQLLGMAETGAGRAVGKGEDLAVSSLLLHAYPDRIAKRREEGGNRYQLSQGRGVRLPRGSDLTASPFLVAAYLDGGENEEGAIHMAEPVTEEIIRRELGAHIEGRRQVEWHRQENRIQSVLTEVLGKLCLSSKPFPASDEEALPILCRVIRSGAAVLNFGREERQFQGRVSLLRRAFPGNNWPDMSDERLLSSPEEWLAPWLAGIRTGERLAGLALLPALKALLSREQRQIIDKEAPAALVVPSGRCISLDYTAGEMPVLAVKLQELFGLAATPTVAGGRVAVLIHLLSPAGRPVQVTRDLPGFWEKGYLQVKKELQGRYPKHHWPDDPWNAVPTHRTKRRNN